MIAVTLHRLFVSAAVLTTAAGIIYLPTKLMYIRTKGKELEEYAAKNGLTLQEAAVQFGYQKPAPKDI